ncbi:MAG: hypothetical protein J6O04_03780 [Selenomonadaceae bacterium]|nr:hypothetical protein [Selenomonadaceae bacterium]
MEERKQNLAATPADEAIESGLEIMHLKNNGADCKKMTVEEFMPFMTAPLGRSDKVSV